MRLPLLDYTEPFNASATLLLVALLLWVGLKEKKNTLPMVVVICSMLILAVQTVELMLNINNVELMVLLVKNIIIGQVYMYLVTLAFFANSFLISAISSSSLSVLNCLFL